MIILKESDDNKVNEKGSEKNRQKIDSPIKHGKI